jgi:hypothetical protein
MYYAGSGSGSDKTPSWERDEKGEAAIKQTMTFIPFIPLRVMYGVQQVDKVGL